MSIPFRQPTPFGQNFEVDNTFIQQNLNPASDFQLSNTFGSLTRSSHRNRSVASQPSASILFIDRGVEAYSTLVAAASPEVEVILLDPMQDGIQQISNVLADRRNLASLHVVTNGQTGRIQLGSTELNSTTIRHYDDQLKAWAKSFTSNGDILLYGCNVASGKGQQLIQQISNLTKTDVAASTDLTGSSDRGGDWILEVKTGAIAASIAFQPRALNAYTGVLDTGDGLRGEYFDNNNFTNPKFTRVDPTISFNWGKNSPATGMNKDTFSVRWTGQVQVAHTEEYTFYTTADDGSKLWLNGQLVVDSSNSRRGQEVSGKIRLNAGQRYDVKLEYFENTADASMALQWSSASQTKQGIPQSMLFSTIPQGSGTISLATSTPPNVSEDAGKASVMVVRTGGSTGAVTVTYSVDGRTALPGSDYITPSGSLTFQEGETSKTIDITLVNDDVFESDEDFTIGLLGTNGVGQVGAPRTATIKIVDDDSPSTVSFSQPSYSVNENSGTASVIVQRTGNIAKPASVNYATSNGSASAGSDYTATSGTVSFASEETSKTISILITNDISVESSETVNLALSNPGKWTTLGSQSTASLTIVDNDSSGTFRRETVLTGLNQPTTIDWTPDGRNMFIAQQNGVVRVMRDGVLQSTSLIDISQRVNGVRDRGLLGLAIHPNFPATPYVYLLYTYDPPEAASTPDSANNRPARLGRFTVTTDAAGNLTAAPSSEVVLLGENSLWAYTSRPDGNSTNDSSIPPSGIKNTTNLAGIPDSALDIDANGNLTKNVRDYLATDSESHTIGAVHFGPDGKLYVSVGDGTSYNFADPRTVRVQDLNNLSGKILRIDPITGDGLSDNPFYSATGGSDNNRDKVFSYGLRNPFRFTFDPVSGQPVLGDVGWNTWEEMNTGRGVNFGWPYYEGGNGTSLRQTTGYGGLPEAQAFYNSGGDQQVTAPIYAQRHADGAIAIIMGDFYDNNRLIFGDVQNGNIYEATLDSNNRRVVSSVRVFDSGLTYVVDMEKGLDGNMYGVNMGNGTIFRWVPG
ncbi:DUF4347 domain-containing protein [Cyanobacteria bacterium FACHB-63]|nr:DUF4347 domain-containing protein [Cyanobacteria bacterium FACHB-63]